MIIMNIRKRGFPLAKPNGALKKFNIEGCSFGENCSLPPFFPWWLQCCCPNDESSVISTSPATTQNGPTSTIKSKMCIRYSTPETGKFSDQCHFAHGDWELGKPIAPSIEDPRTHGPVHGHPAPPGAATSFGASSTAKISVDASLAGAIIGIGGVNSKQICRQTRAKLSIRFHESDSNLKNIELEGTFDQIKEASAMVGEVVLSVSVKPAAAGPLGRPPVMYHGAASHAPKTNHKTKMCENFTKGSCTFGEKCHFAHGAAELRK